MADSKFMEEYIEKLRLKAEEAEKKVQEDLKVFIAKEKENIAKDIRGIFESSQGNPEGELGNVLRNGGDRFGSDDD